MRAWARALLGAVTASAAIAASAGPAAAVEVGPAVTVNPARADTSFPPAVAVSASGDVVVAWADSIPGGVYAAYRPRDGAFGRAQLLSGRRVEGTGVRAAITHSGEAIVAWGENDTLAALGRGRARVVVATRPAGAARFGPAVELSGGQQGARTPWLEATPGGEVVAVWEELRTETGGIRTAPLRVSAAIRDPAGNWDAPVALSAEQQRWTSGVSTPTRERMRPRVAVLGSGAALAVWERASGATSTCCSRVEAALRPVGGAFGPAVALAEAVDTEIAVLRDVKGAGSRWGVLAWNDDVLQLFEGPAPGPLGPPLAIPGALDRFSEAALALAPDGAASVLKGVPLAPDAPCAAELGVDSLATTSRPAGAAFGPDQLVTPSIQPGSSAAALVAGGRALFSWEQPRRSEIEEREPGGCNGFGTKPLVAEGLPGAGPDPGVRASRQRVDGVSPVLAADPSGVAVLAWLGGVGRVRVARIGGGSLGRNRYPDIDPPRLGRVRLRPGIARAGEPMVLRLRPSEAVRLTVRISGPGPFVRRLRARLPRGLGALRLRAPAPRGPYSVELRARDRAGNPTVTSEILGFRVR